MMMTIHRNCRVLWSCLPICCTRGVHTNGLMSLPGLISPESLITNSKAIKIECEQLSEQLLHTSSSSLSAKTIVNTIDRISVALCSVLDVATVIDSVHHSQQWVEAAETTQNLLYPFLETLNTDPNLYQILQRIRTTPTMWNELSLEAQTIVEWQCNDTELRGVHLPQHQREKVVEILSKDMHIGRKFMDNIRNATMPVLHIDEESEEGAIIENYAKLFQVSNVYTDGLPLDTSRADCILENTSNARVRELVLNAKLQAVPENIPVIESLLRNRRELAMLVGKKSYVDIAVAHNILNSYDKVHEFLATLSTRVVDIAKNDLNHLKRLSKQDNIKDYDLIYYSKIYRNTITANYNHDISNYLSLSNVLHGINLITSHLFNATFTIAANDVVLWCLESDAYKILKLELRDNHTNNIIGIVYLDLFQRQLKSWNHPATFVVRSSYFKHDSNDYEIPKVCLVMGLNHTNDGKHDMQAYKLSMYQAENIFHEFGHVLHHLMSRTRHQFLAGARGALDFVEIPSQLMEYFCWDARVLRQYARHYRTNEVIPDDLIENMLKSRNTLSSLRIIEQLIQSMFDIEAHYHVNNIQDIYNDIYHRISLTHSKEPQHPYTTFSHLTHYASNYHSYMHAKVFCAHVWHDKFANDPFNASSGAEFRRFLSRGSSQPSEQICFDFLGKPTSIEPFIEEIEGTTAP